jgi:hypothetical protein
VFDQENEVDVDGFLRYCERIMDTKDYELVIAAQLNDFPALPKSNDVLAKWQAWEKTLRNELVRLRAQELGLDPVEFLAPVDEIPEAKDVAREAFNQESPLQAEITLMRYRWNFLDQMGIGHFFDVEEIIIYCLKVQILARKAQLNPEKGKQDFDQIYKQITTGEEKEQKVSVSVV